MLPGIITRKINGLVISNIQGYEGVDFIENINYVGSFLLKVLNIIKLSLVTHPELYKSIGINYYYFDDNRGIYDLGGNSFLIEYNNITIRNKDIIAYKLNYEIDGSYSLLREKGRHFPFLGTYFNYLDKYYIIIDGNNRLTEEVSDIVYKGVIINISKYLSI